MADVQLSFQSVPYLTVGIDGRGSTCWMVVTKDMRLPCTCGWRAFSLLRAICKSKGISTPV